jgi:hypothetical protein
MAKKNMKNNLINTKSNFLTKQELASGATDISSGDVNIIKQNAKEMAAEKGLRTLILHAEYTMTSNVGGAITAVLGTDSISGVNNLTSLSSTFDEYRVLGMSLHYMPNDRYNRGVSVYTAPIFGVIDRDASTVLSSYVQAADYESVRELSLDTPWKFEAWASDANDLRFQNSQVAYVGTFWEKFWATGLTASTQYGLILATYWVQVRGVGV